MAIEHVNITDPNIHEPKGAAAAGVNTSYVSNGAGSGSWVKIPTQGMAGVAANGTSGQVFVVDGAGSQELAWDTAHGATYFTNIGTPNTITYPSVYTKVNPTTTAGGGAIEFTEATTARITYTGTRVRHGLVSAIVAISQASGADRDIRIAIYKNGLLLANSEAIVTSTTGSKRTLATQVDTSFALNDYFEAYVRNDGASGDVLVYTLKLQARAFLD
jgi:hypothetical protein